MARGTDMANGEEFDPAKAATEEAGEQKFYGFEEDVSGIQVPAELPICRSAVWSSFRRRSRRC